MLGNLEKRIRIIMLIIGMAGLVAACGESGQEESQTVQTAEEDAAPSETQTEPEYVLKAAHTHAVGSLIDTALNDLAARISEKTGGRVAFEFYPSGQLGDKIANMESLRAGTLEVCEAAITDMSGFKDSWSVFCLPFLFEDSQQCFDVYSDETFFSMLQEDAAEEGFHLLSYINVGARSLISPKRLFQAPEDCVGIKIRSLQDKYVARTMELMGFSVVPLGWTEVYTALQQGTVDAADNSAPLLRDAMLQEVADQFTVFEAVRMPDIIVMSKQYWDALPAEIQEQINEACEEYLEAQWQSYEAVEDEAIAEFEEEGVTIGYIDEAGLEAFKEVTQPVYDELFTDIPEAVEIYDMLVGTKEE